MTFAQQFDTDATLAPSDDLDLTKPPRKRQSVILPALKNALHYQEPDGIILFVVLTTDSKQRSRPVLALPEQRDPRLSRSDMEFTLQEGECVMLPCSHYPKVTDTRVTVRMSRDEIPIDGGEGESYGTAFHVITARCDDSGLIEIPRDLWDEVSN
jgi:hypothetical protein